MRSKDFYELDFAVNFHRRLNPRVWNENDQMHSEVREALLKIADDFQQFLGLDQFDLLDITVSGSNAAYTYTPYSDLDLHLVTMIPAEHEEFRQLFDAKKYQYNDMHKILVRGIDVELYVQDAEQPHASTGVYSVLRERWIKRATRRRADIDDANVQQKFRVMKNRINHAILSDDIDRVQAVWDDLKTMRKTGLTREGEFSPENLAFKILRAQGAIEKLIAHIRGIKSHQLSIDEDHSRIRPMKYKEIVQERILGGFDVKPLKIQDQDQDLEELKLNAPQRRIPRDELQGYADRIKTGTKTKQDKFSPIIHGSNIKAITKDDGGEEWDLDDLAQQIMKRPSKILGTNAKMEKSATEGEIIYDLTLPALSGIVVDEDNGDFVEITTCPGAGECQLYCYARKGGYVMFPASSMSAAQALNFLVNDPVGYMNMVDREVKTLKGRTDKRGIQLVVRWHDAGDFFSKEYLDLAYRVAGDNPEVEFYAYTKMGDVAVGSKPANFIVNFSAGAKSREVKTVAMHKQAGNVVKDAITVPKDMFRELFVTDAKGKYVKDEKGRTQIKSSEQWKQFSQDLAARYDLDPDTIITYDQMLTIPEGPQPKWHVVIFPAGHGDRAANRLDVINSFLMFH